MNQLYNFLTDVAVNPQQQAAFLANPDAVMSMAGLAEEEQAILNSGERTQISLAFPNEFALCASAFREPDPDPSPDSDSSYRH